MNPTLRILAAGALLLIPAFGYIRIGYVEGGSSTFIPLKRTDNKAIQFYINDKVVPGASSSAIGAPVKVVSDGSDPVTGIREAFAAWNRVAGADIKFLPLKSTDAFHSSTDNKNVVAFGNTNDDLAALGYSPGGATGALAVTLTVSYQEKGTTPEGVAVDKGDIFDSDIVLNPAGAPKDLLYSTDGSTPVDVQTVLTHEIGHALGMNHTGLLGSTMFQFSIIGKSAVYSEKLISADERAFAAAVYPTGGVALGTLGGKVTLGGSAVKGALVTLTDTATGVMLGTITGSDGTYSLLVPVGTYIVSAEPFNSIVGVANITGYDPAQVTTGFQHTMAGGATPAPAKVNAGASSTLDVAVNAASGTLTLPFSAIGTAGGTKDITNLNGMNGPLILASGRSVDIAFLAGGFDATTVVQVYGPGISVRAGSTRVDTGVNFSQGPLVRATLDIAARETPALATLTLSKGSGTLALSGYFVIVPPKPVFTSKSLVNAASFLGLNGNGVVSPGGFTAIFASQNSFLGPAVPTGNGDFDEYARLAGFLAGVSVTFDGVPAPLFLSFAGQLNVQVPFEIAGKTSTEVQVNYNGSLSDKITVPVVASQPAFFTVSGGGGSDSIVANPEPDPVRVPGSPYLNTANTPAARGTVVSFFGTGLGKPSYSIPTGGKTPNPPGGYSGNNTCSVAGKTIAVPFAGYTPTQVGLAQWSFVIPADTPTGKVSVKCTDANGASTQEGTLYVK